MILHLRMKSEPVAWRRVSEAFALPNCAPKQETGRYVPGFMDDVYLLGAMGLLRAGSPSFPSDLLVAYDFNQRNLCKHCGFVV